MPGYDSQLIAGTAGSLNHEKEDAEDLAAWNVDYFKYDNCYNLGQSGTALISFNRYKAMGDALNATGRPIVYSLCSWGEDQVHTVCGIRLSLSTPCPPCLPLPYLYSYVNAESSGACP